MSPRTEQQNEKIKDGRREQILRSALKLFAKRGLAATKISDIAEASKFSQGLVYHYFRSKEEVYTELVRRAVESSGTALIELEKLPLPPAEKVKTITCLILDNISENEESAFYFMLMTQAMVSEANPEEAKEHIKRSSVPNEVMVRIIEEGQKTGEIAKGVPWEMSMAFWAGVTGLALYKVTEGETFQMPDPLLLARIILN